MRNQNGFVRRDVVVLGFVILLLVCMSSIWAGSRAVHTDFHRNITCQNNLKSYGSALMMYLDDNEQRFPNSYTWLYSSEWSWGISTAAWCRWHNKSENLENHPEFAGSFFKYVADKNNHLCPTFDKLAKSGLGAQHVGHDEKIPMDPQYTYSMNGFLGQPRRTRFGVVEKLGQIERNPAEIFSFTEENVMWNIQGRSAANAVLSNNNVVSRINSAAIRQKDGSLFSAEDYNGAFATFHMAPAEEIELDESGFAVQSGDNYSEWGLCRGSGNAVFLDQHVQSRPYHVDTHDYAWPLRK